LWKWLRQVNSLTLQTPSDAKVFYNKFSNTRDNHEKTNNSVSYDSIIAWLFR
jgi:hypothetical protein